MTFDPAQLEASTPPKAKSRSNKKDKPELPADDGEQQELVEQTNELASDPAVQQAIVEAATATAPTGLVEVPIDCCFPGFASSRFEFQSTPRQAAAAKILMSSLSNRGERYVGGRSQHPRGKVVENHHDGIRWLLDRLADEIEAATGKDLLRDFNLTFR